MIMYPQLLQKKKKTNIFLSNREIVFFFFSNISIGNGAIIVQVTFSRHEINNTIEKFINMSTYSFNCN